jgi:uncharacterized cupin superfamily protein
MSSRVVELLPVGERANQQVVNTPDRDARLLCAIAEHESLSVNGRAEAGEAV